MFIALVLIVMNFVADLLYTVLDPRVSHGRRGRPALPPHAGQRRSRPGACRALMRWLQLPQNDPLAITGVMIYVRLRCWSRSSPTCWPPTIRSRSSSRRTATSPRTCRRASNYPLGTTNLGRDIFSQLVIGTRSALLVGLTAAVVVVARRHDRRPRLRLFRRLDRPGADAARRHRARHPLPALRHRAGGASSGRSTSNVVLADRRAALAQHRARHPLPGADGARARLRRGGAGHRRQSTWRILFVHVAPNILPLSLLYGSIAIGWAILTEASVSFLGFGVRLACRGATCCRTPMPRRRCRAAATTGSCRPGICIVLVVVAGFFISRGYEEILFPKLKD